MGISNSAVLVEMNISVWTAQKVDRSVTDKATSDNNASHDAGLFRKNLMAGSSLRKDIADYAALCRTWHVGQTMPWADKGVRLLPMSKFLDYKTEVNNRRAYFTSKTDEFRLVYPNLQTLAAQSLGAMFDPSEYPSLDEVMSKFAFGLVFSPVPEAGDFRLDAGIAEIEELREQWQLESNSRVEQAVGTMFKRAHAMLKGMSDKLAESDGKKIFHATFLTNAVEMCELLGHTSGMLDNGEDREDLEFIRNELEAAIAHVDIDDVRKNEEVRSDIKSKLDAVIGAFDSW